MGDTAGPFKEIEDQFLKGWLSGAKENCKLKAGNSVQLYLHSNLLLYYLQGVFKGNNYSLNNFKYIITLNRGRHSISSLPQQAASSHHLPWGPCSTIQPMFPDFSDQAGSPMPPSKTLWVTFCL